MQEHKRKKNGTRVIDAIAAHSARRADGSPLAGRVGSIFSDELAFMRGFLAHPRQVGSVVPSSIALEQRLVRAADLARAQTVVELGPGTGGTTRALLDSLRPDARLLAVELSPEFHARLVGRFSDPRLLPQLGSAEQLGELLQRWRLPAPDVVLSGIPFSTMPPAIADRIANIIADCLAPGGRFVAYQVRAHVADFVSPYLGPPAIAWELRNVPPLRVFRWVKRDGA
ncbi:MAG TPA: methyltransferase type 12 [Burkholderiaceae bacterium]|nr:methyltransferase type 12 [Burkholderiaceae bacterium]